MIGLTANDEWAHDAGHSRLNQTVLALELVFRGLIRTRAVVVLVSKDMNVIANRPGRALTILALCCAGLLAAALACNNDAAGPATSTPRSLPTVQIPAATAQAIPPTAVVSTPAVSPTAVVTPTISAGTLKLAPTPTQIEQAQRLMWSILQPGNKVSEGAIALAGLVGHPGLVPVLLEAATVTLDPEIALTIADALERLTGERVGGDYVLVEPWIEWMGQQDDIVELPEFAAWKGELYSRIDPSFRDFFYEGVPHTIPLWSPMWGGVLRDGIPPLENPKVIPASEAGYLKPDEPVFGVVVNGEARAYPWRIMAWHELSNDIVGGKHISVVF